MKKISIFVLIAIAMSSCSDNASTSDNVSIKATAVSSTGKTSSTSRTAASTVVITDFKVNIGNIKLETDMEDDMHSTDSSYEDVKLVGPFLLDLLDPNKPLSQFITTVDVPNAKYEEIKFNFTKSLVAGDLLGKTFLIKGTINDKPFVVWSSENIELEMDFVDPSKDFAINDNSVALNIKIQLDVLMAKINSLANQGLLLDTDGDGIIEITTGSDDGHSSFGHQIKELLEDETHLDDKD
ncbi:hypothetical protein [Flavobacterium franklandianum]|uniref:hypothetical protein n=1 Tax=Flavobacterium franklandianum TaxID=2594430 RepID=UPI001F2FA5D9|nr:hypothetical protein [Flavobacterium franklandianum]